MEERDFICVTCPVGCTIKARVQDGKLLEVLGNACKRGQAFVEEEMRDPRRVLTTSVRVEGGRLPLVPVRTVAPIPKHLLMDASAYLRTITLEAPVEAAQPVTEDLLGTGVAVITSRAMPVRMNGSLCGEDSCG